MASKERTVDDYFRGRLSAEEILGLAGDDGSTGVPAPTRSTAVPTTTSSIMAFLALIGPFPVPLDGDAIDVDLSDRSNPAALRKGTS